MAEDQTSLIALLRRTTDPDGWLDPMLADPDSAAALGANVAQFARLGRAVDYNSKLALISEAPGGSPGTCAVTVTRVASGTSGTIPKGYQFADARGLLFVVSTPVTVGSGVTSVILPLQSLRQAEALNTEDDPGMSISSINQVVKDGSNTSLLIAAVGDLAAVSTTFQAVVSCTQVLGGTSDYLSALGAERGCYRQSGETTESYRARVRNIPDAVSPLAVATAVAGAASAAGAGAVVVEPFDDGADPAVKIPHDLAVFFLHTNDVDFLDDVGTPEILRYSAREVTCYFRVDLVGALKDSGEIVKFHDGSFHDDFALGYRDMVLPPAAYAAGAGVWGEANAKRAGGVQFDVVLPDVVQKQTVLGSSSNALGANVASVIAPVGGALYLYDLLVNHDVASGARSTHWVVFTFVDGSTYSTEFPSAWDKPWSQRLPPSALAQVVPELLPLTQIDLWTRQADDATSTRAVMTVWSVPLLSYP